MECKSPDTVPNHVAIIMDGNNRWASEKDLPGVAGHQKGVERAIGNLRNEIERDMKLMGVSSIDQLTKKNLKFR